LVSTKSWAAGRRPCSVDRANQVLRFIGKGDKVQLVLPPQPVLDELGALCWPWLRHLAICQGRQMAVSLPLT